MATEPEDKNVPWKALRVARKRHGCKKIIVVHHQDCGAYGGSKFFGDVQEEETFHMEKMKEFRGRVLEMFPEMKVEMIYARLIDGHRLQFVLI